MKLSNSESLPESGERGLAGVQRGNRRRLLGDAHGRGVEIDARGGRRPGERGVDRRVPALRLEHADHLRPEDVRRVEVGVDHGRERLRALRRLARRLQRERGVVHAIAARSARRGTSPRRGSRRLRRAR